MLSAPVPAWSSTSGYSNSRAAGNTANRRAGRLGSSRYEKLPSLESKEERGFGGSAQVVLAPYAEFGLNYARGLVDVIDDQGGLNAESSYDITSMGGFANVRVIEDLVIGAGINKTNKLNQKKDPTAAMASSDTFRGSAPSNTWSRSSCTSSWSPPTRSRISTRPSRRNAAFSNTMFSTRLRFMYLF